MTSLNFDNLFSEETLSKIFPLSRSDAFFEALFGDKEEGSFDISLKYTGNDQEENQLHFEILLEERPGKCLSCNLTYGLPDVFSRHPVIDLKGFVQEVEKLLNNNFKCTEWSLGHTRTLTNDVHAIPLTISMDQT